MPFRKEPFFVFPFRRKKKGIDTNQKGGTDPFSISFVFFSPFCTDGKRYVSIPSEKVSISRSDVLVSKGMHRRFQLERDLPFRKGRWRTKGRKDERTRKKKKQRSAILLLFFPLSKEDVISDRFHAHLARNDLLLSLASCSVFSSSASFRFLSPNSKNQWMPSCLVGNAKRNERVYPLVREGKTSRLVFDARRKSIHLSYEQGKKETVSSEDHLLLPLPVRIHADPSASFPLVHEDLLA